jgi:hypothetical protein
MAWQSHIYHHYHDHFVVIATVRRHTHQQDQQGMAVMDKVPAGLIPQVSKLNFIT